MVDDCKNHGDGALDTGRWLRIRGCGGKQHEMIVANGEEGGD